MKDNRNYKAKLVVNKVRIENSTDLLKNIIHKHQ